MSVHVRVWRNSGQGAWAVQRRSYPLALQSQLLSPLKGWLVCRQHRLLCLTPQNDASRQAGPPPSLPSTHAHHLSGDLHLRMGLSGSPAIGRPLLSPRCAMPSPWRFPNGQVAVGSKAVGSVTLRGFVGVCGGGSVFEWCTYLCCKCWWNISTCFRL